MRSVNALLLAIAALISPAADAATIVVLGDSISAAYGMPHDAGWVSLLAIRVAASNPPHVVVNASISGETTGGGLARLPDLLARQRPEVVVVELGGNDGLRGYPIARIRANLERIIALSQQAGATVVLLGMQIPPNYGDRYVRAFHANYGRLANKGVEVVPFLLEGVALRSQLMQDDGIHPTAEAQPVLLENAWPAIRVALERIAAPDAASAAETETGSQR